MESSQGRRYHSLGWQIRYLRAWSGAIENGQDLQCGDNADVITHMQWHKYAGYFRQGADQCPQRNALGGNFFWIVASSFLCLDDSGMHRRSRMCLWILEVPRCVPYVCPDWNKHNWNSVGLVVQQIQMTVLVVMHMISPCDHIASACNTCPYLWARMCHRSTVFLSSMPHFFWISAI